MSECMIGQQANELNYILRRNERALRKKNVWVGRVIDPERLVWVDLMKNIDLDFVDDDLLEGPKPIDQK